MKIWHKKPLENQTVNNMLITIENTRFYKPSVFNVFAIPPL